MPPEPNDSLLREVEDALRYDRLMNLWRQYRAPFFAAVIALIVATAGGSLWREYRESRATDTLGALASAHRFYEQGRYDAAAKGFAQAEEEAFTGEARDLARLWQGRALEQGGESEKAVDTYASLADKPQGGDLIWRDLACLHLAGIAGERAADCLKAGGSPLQHERALIEAARLWQAGDAKAADAKLAALAEDANAAEPLRRRAREYRTALAGTEK